MNDQHGPTATESSTDGGDLRTVVAALCEGNTDVDRPRSWNPNDHPLPSRSVVVSMTEDLRSVLFPGFFGTSELSPDALQFHVGARLDHVLTTLQEQVKRGLCFACNFDVTRCRFCDEAALQVTRALLRKLPEIRRMLMTDVRAAYEGDPAATSMGEAVFCYPGVMALTCHRIAHELYHLDVPLLPRMINEHAHSLTGIDIHPGAHIGEGLFIDHGTGVVIGETSIIGNQVRIYQGVTLGAKSFPLDEDGNPIKGIPRHPIVEDDVIIYSGATILGRVTIGRGSVIGGNVWLVRSVPPFSRLIQTPAREEDFEGGAGI